MAVLKAINGHTGCGRIKDYLEKGGRALLRDFFNLSWDEVEDKGLDAALKDEVDWALEMDALRHDYGNDTPWKGQRAITFRHYVISPDPGDGIDLEGLRGLTHVWVRKHFSDYQVAVIYHDDNRQRIPHAHIVVNNTNLETGRRLHIPNALDMNRSLQEVARARGLAAFDNEMPKGRVGRSDPRTPPRPRTRWPTYINKAERGILDAGAYSWVSDIRNRVSVAINDGAELGNLAKAIETNARYSIESSADYGRRIETLQRRMEREPESKAAAKCAERIQELAEAREYASRHSLVPDEVPARRHQSTGSDRWRYEPQRSGSRTQGAARGSSAARRDSRDRQQEGRNR